MLMVAGCLLPILEYGLGENFHIAIVNVVGQFRDEGRFDSGCDQLDRFHVEFGKSVYCPPHTGIASFEL